MLSLLFCCCCCCCCHPICCLRRNVPLDTLLKDAPAGIKLFVVLGAYDLHSSYVLSGYKLQYYSRVCVCVCVFSSHSFWTSSSLDVPAGVTQEEGHTGFLIHLLSAVRALIFLARRIQPLFSLVDRKVELCVLTI